MIETPRADQAPLVVATS